MGSAAQQRVSLPLRYTPLATPNRSCQGLFQFSSEGQRLPSDVCVLVAFITVALLPVNQNMCPLVFFLKRLLLCFQIEICDVGRDESVVNHVCAAVCVCSLNHRSRIAHGPSKPPPTTTTTFMLSFMLFFGPVVIFSTRMFRCSLKKIIMAGFFYFLFF